MFFKRNYFQLPLRVAFSLCTKVCEKKAKWSEPVLCLLCKTVVSEKVLCVFRCFFCLFSLFFLLPYYSNILIWSYSKLKIEIFSYRPDHFPIFVGRSTSFLGAMFKKATHQPLLVNVCQLTRHKVLFKRFTVTDVKLGAFSSWVWHQITFLWINYLDSYYLKYLWVI